MEATVYNLPVKEPVFLKENWKRLLGECTNDEYKYVRILNGVANITSGEVLIRCPIGLGDGFYVIGSGGELKPVQSLGQNPLAPRKGYPDVEYFRPHFERMVPSEQIPAKLVGELIVWLEFVKNSQSNVVVTKNGFAMNTYASRLPEEYPRTSQMEPQMVERMTFDFRRALGIELPVAGEGVTFSPSNLKLALTEMLRYDFCYISRDEHELSSKSAPLVIGHDWGHCALVAPAFGYYR